MEFRQPQAIYLQLADYLCEQILRRELQANDKIHSVRDLAMLVEVNPNTVVRAYNLLEEQGIIYKERGIGYFVAARGYEQALKLKKEYFLKEHLPLIVKNLQLLGISFSQFQELYENQIKTKIK